MNEHQDRYDKKTGAVNRQTFDRRVEEAIQSAHRAGASFALCLLDLDGFKDIHDRLGHDAGDAVLKEVATRLRAVLWTGDVVGRYGGDEFTVLLAGADRERSGRAATKMTRAVETPVDMGGETLTPSISVGIAVYPDDGATPEALLARASHDVQRIKSDKSHPA